MTLTKGDKKLIRGWTFYDWANSSYPLIICSAIFPIFFVNVTSTKGVDGKIIGDMVSLFGFDFKNTELYDYVVALSFIVVSFLSPFLSGIADYIGNKKLFLKFFCFLGALSCATLYFFSKENLGFGLLSIFIASVGYWGSLVYYNAYLPEIAEPEDHDKISARGFAMGYIGAVTLLVINLILIKGFGMNVRYTFITVAVWWLSFAHITFRYLPVMKQHNIKEKNIFFKGFNELQKVWNELKQMKQIKRFLLAFFMYSMGVQTVMLMAVMFAKKEIPGLSDTNLIISVLLIQFLGIAGSFLLSKISSKIGNLRSLMITILIWIGICVGTYKFVFTPFHFYIVAATVGLVMGGIQSLSRSTYSKMIPDTTDNASFFSFYDVTEKIGIVVGMFSFGFIEGITGGMRNSVLALVIFFVMGFFVLWTVPKSEKVR